MCLLRATLLIQLQRTQTRKGAGEEGKLQGFRMARTVPALASPSCAEWCNCNLVFWQVLQLLPNYKKHAYKSCGFHPWVDPWVV